MVSKGATGHADVTLTEGLQPASSILEKKCKDTVDQAASSVDIDDAKGEAVTTQKLNLASSTTL